MTDKELIARFQARDESVLRDTAAQYGGYCGKIAAGILGNQEDAEECCNDTWLRAWNAIPPYVPVCMRTFLAKITRNLAFDRVRRNNAEKRSGTIGTALDELAECVAGSENVEAAVDAHALGEAVNAFLHSLPERECNVFLRRYFYTESTAEIAKRYQLKNANVLLILSRTRKKLRSFLTEQGYL